MLLMAQLSCSGLLRMLRAATWVLVSTTWVLVSTTCPGMLPDQHRPKNTCLTGPQVRAALFYFGRLGLRATAKNLILPVVNLHLYRPNRCYNWLHSKRAETWVTCWLTVAAKTLNLPDGSPAWQIVSRTAFNWN